MHIKKEKEFIIHIVPNRFNVDYAKYIEDAKDVIKLNDKYQQAKTIEDKNKIEKEIEAFGLQEILNNKYGLIKTLMIANDYEFDSEWWDNRADPQDIENMIAACALKDKTYSSKKKALQAS